LRHNFPPSDHAPKLHRNKAVNGDSFVTAHPDHRILKHSYDCVDHRTATPARRPIFAIYLRNESFSGFRTV